VFCAFVSNGFADSAATVPNNQTTPTNTTIISKQNAAFLLDTGLLCIQPAHTHTTHHLYIASEAPQCIQTNSQLDSEAFDASEVNATSNQCKKYQMQSSDIEASEASTLMCFVCVYV